MKPACCQSKCWDKRNIQMYGFYCLFSNNKTQNFLLGRFAPALNFFSRGASRVARQAATSHHPHEQNHDAHGRFLTPRRRRGLLAVLAEHFVARTSPASWHRLWQGATRAEHVVAGAPAGWLWCYLFWGGARGLGFRLAVAVATGDGLRSDSRFGAGGWCAAARSVAS